MELVGVGVPSGPGAVEEMVRTCAAEFRRQGWDRPRILAIFRSPHYASVHGAWRLLGEARCAALVDEALEPFLPPPVATGAAPKEA
jgi:hypothetical protein